MLEYIAGVIGRTAIVLFLTPIILLLAGLTLALGLVALAVILPFFLLACIFIEDF